MLLRTGLSTGIPGSFVLQSNGGSSYLAFNTNGANERMRITSAGNVGIGEASPDNILHITKDQSAASSALKLENKAGADDSGFDIDFQLATSGISAKIGAIRTNSPGAGDSDIFFSTSTNGTSVTEAMRIKHDGIVGIGTNSPGEKLEIYTDGTDVALKIHEDAGTHEARLHLRRGGSDWELINNQHLTIESEGSEMFRITTAGDVGIGTNNPDHQLHIEFANTDTAFSGGSGGAWGSEGIRIENTSATANTMAMLHLRNNDADIHIAGIRQGTDNSDLGLFFEGNEKVRFTNDGKVGIGTNNPDVALHVESEDETVLRVERTAGSGFTAIDIKDGAGTTGNSAIRFSDTGGSPGEINYEHADNSLRISTNSSERIRIKSDGKVGIGTTNPNTHFHVNGEQLIKRVDTSTAYHGTLNIKANVVAANSNHARSAFINLQGAAVSSNNVTNYDFVLGTHHSGDFIIARDNTFAGGYDSGSLKIDKDDLTVTVEKNLIVNEKLGVGNISPNSKLDIRQAGDGIALELHNTGGNVDDFIDIKMIAGNTNAGTLGTILRHKRDGSGGGDFSILTNPTLTGTPTEKFIVKSDGEIKLNTYGSATHTGTATKTLQVDSSGNIIEGAIVNFAPKVEYQTVSSDIAANTTITLPNSLTYTTSSGGYEYLEVFIDGIRLMRNIDFQEISTSSIKLLMAVPATSVFTFKSIT